MKIKKLTHALCILSLALLLSNCNTSPEYIDIPIQNNTQISSTIENFTYTHIEDKHYKYNAILGVEHLKYDNGYLYFFNGIASPHEKTGATLMAFDLAHGKILSVCPDPLCSHDNPECDFYGFDVSYYVFNNSIYYRRGYHYLVYNDEGILVDTIDLADLVRYNTETTKLTVYEDYNGDWTYSAYNSQLYVDNYQYFYDYVYDPESNKHYFHICRRDIDTGEKTYLGGSLNEEVVYERFLFEHGGRIYITDGKTIYSVTYDWTDRKEHYTGDFSGQVLTNGQDIFFETSNENNSLTINKINLLDANETASPLGFECSRWYLTDNYIYFLSADTYYSGDIALTGSEIYRCDHNGNNTEKICSLIDQNSTKYVSSMCIVDNYIYCFYFEYENGTQLSYRDKLLRIDTSTGEKSYFDIK